MDYRICLVRRDAMFEEREAVGLLHKVEEADTWLVRDSDEMHDKALNEFVDSFATEGIALYAESRAGGAEFGPFDMWVTRPSYLCDLDVIVFPDVIHAVFDYKIDGWYVRLSPIKESSSFPRFS